MIIATDGEKDKPLFFPPASPQPQDLELAQQRKEMSDACSAFFPETIQGCCHELRILTYDDGKNYNKPASGYFKTAEKLVEFAMRFDRRKSEAVYFTPNQVKEDLWHRAADKVKERAQLTTNDKQIIWRKWLLVDVDSIKDAGISSTNAELQATQEASVAIVQWLKDEHGYPDPVIAMSGNGWHLCYRIELPNDAVSEELVDRVLTAIHQKCGTDKVKIDIVCKNASRIWKLPGCTSRKGDNTDDRPHRRSRLISWKPYKDLAIVSTEQLEKVAQLVQRTPVVSATTTTASTAKQAKPSDLPPGKHVYDLEQLIQLIGASIRQTKPMRGGGTLFVLDSCVFNPDHVNTSAALGYGKDDSCFYQCFHDSCKSNRWREFAAMFPEQVKASITPEAKAQAKQRAADRRAAKEEADESAQCMALAEKYIEDHFQDSSGHRTAVCFADELYAYESTHYAPIPRAEFRRTVLVWLQGHVEDPNPKLARDVVECILALCQIPSRTAPPMWIGPKELGPSRPCDWISVANGIVNIAPVLRAENAQLMLHTPQWFSLNCLPFDYDLTADCPTFHNFLDQSLRSDKQLVDLLIEWFGYCCVSDTSFQKLMILAGPPRTGKGATCRVLRSLIGTDNSSGARLSTLGETFGLQGLLGKTNAIVPDAHLGKGAGALGVLEILKGITGEDAIEVHRKHLPSITTRLTARFTIGVNELPRFGDSANAISSRLLIIPYENSVKGKEDRQLEHKLQSELSGIFNLALHGLARLYVNKKFTEPEASKQVSEDFRRLTSPVGAFLSDMCTVSITGQVSSDRLWQVWNEWCRTNGHLPGSRETFGAHLRTIPGLQRKQITCTGGVRPWHYVGIHLNSSPDWKSQPVEPDEKLSSS